MVAFVPMSDADFQAFLRKFIPEYAYEQTQSGNWHANEAMARAQQEIRQILPQGPKSEHQFLFNIVDTERGQQRVGMIWYTLDSVSLNKKIFLSEFFIMNEFRGKGYEQEALAELKAKAHEAGVSRIETHVFAKNPAEVELFQNNGFEAVSIFMGFKVAE
jgi:ribosomal protein S18 acetylase RimI-like enzyme